MQTTLCWRNAALAATAIALLGVWLPAAAPDKAVLGAVEGTRKDIVEPAVSMGLTLWNRLGGQASVSKVVDDFVKTAKDDPAVNLDHYGQRKLDEARLAAVKKNLINLISHAADGPYRFDDKELREDRRGLSGIGLGVWGKTVNDEFDAAVPHLKRALEKHKIDAADVDAVLKAVAVLHRRILNEIMSDFGKKKVEPVNPNLTVLSGVVTVDGKPLTYGFVTFVDADGRKFSANIQQDGKYVFNKGFPPGKYKVLVEDSPTPAASGEKRLPIPAAFQSLAMTPLLLQAEKGRATHDIDLK
jgi:hypothetical protein